jgi:hypothetical protein
MIRKQLDLPPDVAHTFVDDMRAYFAEDNPIKRDGRIELSLRGTGIRRSNTACTSVRRAAST